MRSIILGKGGIAAMTRQGNTVRHQVLEFVEAYVEDNGYPPTYDEIREAVGLSSKSHVDYYLQALEGDGLIRRAPRTPRGLQVIGVSPPTFEIKVEGLIAAGSPVELLDSPGEAIEVTTDVADPRRDLFALRVCGNSMVDALVGDGDLLIVERRSEAAQGQMAVVHLVNSNAATLKRVYREGARVRLQPAHPTMPPLFADARDVQIQGRVVGLIRRM
jgi:repressor LexA